MTHDDSVSAAGQVGSGGGDFHPDRALFPAAPFGLIFFGSGGFLHGPGVGRHGGHDGHLQVGIGLRGAVAMVGCNNPKVRPDTAHIELMKKLLENDIILIVSGCSAQAAAKAGLMDPEKAKDYCGAGLKRVCELAGIPPVLHMGSCVDISRMMILASDIAKDWGIHISQVPVVGCAPEWMSEKAVSIGNYVVATGIETFLGVDPYTKGSEEVTALLQGEHGVKDWVEAKFVVETDIEKLGDKMIECIEAKRAALGI